MRKTITVILALTMILSMCITASATEQVDALYTGINFRADGRPVSVETYNINNYGYYKLRDIAAMVVDTEKEFSVAWDGEKGMITLTAGGEYTPTSSDLQAGDGKSKKAVPSSASVVINGKEVSLTAYNINGYNYFKLRDICAALNIGVVWDSSTSTSGVATTRGYYDSQPQVAAVPTSITIRDVSVSWSNAETQLYIGQSTQLDVNIYPTKANSGIYWTSSDPTVASIDDYGYVTAHKNGTATITAETYNGKKDTFTIKVPYAAAQLTYKLTADGNGYEVTGCDTTAYTVNIPAAYNDLPVVSVAYGAFKDCEKLRSITVDDSNAALYDDGGVVFTDTPEKTLVCFPPAYDAAEYYYVPQGTIAIAPYAFAGLRTLNTLTMYEGFKSIGDCAFYNIAADGHFNLMVYAPDSLTKIGKNLLQGQRRNVAIYAHRDTTIVDYANANQIPCGIIMPFKGDDTTVDLTLPASLSSSEMYPMNSGKIVYHNTSYVKTYSEYEWTIDAFVDISDYQNGQNGEVRVMLEQVWNAIIPDIYGNTRIKHAPQTGLYGAGYTEGEAILRGYDLKGNLVAMQYISGDFAFSFPGAYNLGIEGGKNTTFSALPVEPVYISSIGSYALEPLTWYPTSEESPIQYYIVQIPHAVFTQQFSMDTNLVTYNFMDATSRNSVIYSESTPHYVIGATKLSDASRLEQMSVVSFVFDGMKCVWEDENIKCMVSSQYKNGDVFGQKAAAWIEKVKSTMVGTYFPENVPVKQITIDSTASWTPTASNGNIQLTQDAIEEFSEYVLVHESVHAIDQNIENIAQGWYIPSPWMEGRAEYIAAKVLYGNGAPGYYDWSFLSEKDKADFFHYYYYSTNRFTEYPVGQHFFNYIIETYGEGASVKIMENIAALPPTDNYGQMTDEFREQCAQAFKKCVEDATEVGVFQNFVRDVIEK